MGASRVFVSVVIPAYNAESTIRTAIQSVLNQSHTNFELIAINDGSQDSTLEILQSINDPRLIIINQRENKGLVESLNAGISLSQGKYIARMDADDISALDRLEEQVKFLENNPEIGVLGTAFESIDPGGQMTTVRYKSNHNAIAFRHLYQIHLCHPTVIIRKSVLESNNLRYNQAFVHAEDYDLFNQLLKVSKAANLPTVHLVKVNGNQTVSNTHQQIQEENARRAKLELFEWLYVQLTPSLLEDYRKLNHQDYSSIQVAPKEIGRVLIQLLRGNLKRGFIQHAFLLKELSKLWFHFCLNKRAPFAFATVLVQMFLLFKKP